MRAADIRSMMLVLRAWLYGGDNDGDARRMDEFIIRKAASGHYGLMRLIFEMVDGKSHKTAEDEVTFEGGCVVVVAEDERESKVVKAA
jgi:hypothetical protein